MELMYITNKTDIASLAQDAGVDRIFVDMEYIGKELRQGGLDTVQSHHTIDDIKALRPILTKSKLLVRCNPIHGATKDYLSSAREIDEIVKAGADIIMLPYFKTTREVKLFIDLVAGRAKTCLLLETSEAQDIIDDILELRGIDEIYIGLNDLHLSKNMTFMFELLADGTVEALTSKIKKRVYATASAVLQESVRVLSLPSVYWESIIVSAHSVLFCREPFAMPQRSPILLR